MNLRVQKELASRALNVPTDRVKFRAKDDDDIDRIKNLLTRADVRELITDGVLVKLPKRGNSRTRANHIAEQKKKGRRQGQGSRKGTKNARFGRKKKWMIKIRALRKYIKVLKTEGKVEVSAYRELYKKSSANVFRNKRHMISFMEQNNMLVENGKK